NIIDATDSVYWIENQKQFVAKDTRNPWFTIWGSSLPAISHDTLVVPPVETNGLGKAGSVVNKLDIKPHSASTVVFVISGSNKDLETAETNYQSIFKNYKNLLNAKKQHYAAIIHRARVDITDAKLQEAYSWGKLNTEWLVSELPGVGRFLGAGA